MDPSAETSSPSSPPEPRWQRRPAERPREILDAAAMVFGERGFESATLADVAERAGVSPGTVQHYFGTKSSLFHEVLSDRFFSGAAEDEALLINHRGSYRDLLRVLLERNWARLSRPGNAELVLVGMASGGNCREARGVVSGELGTRCPRVLQGVLEAGVQAGEFRPLDAETLSRVLGAAIIGLVVGRRRFTQFCQGGPEPAAVLHELLELVDRGLATETTKTKELPAS